MKYGYESLFMYFFKDNMTWKKILQTKGIEIRIKTRIMSALTHITMEEKYFEAFLSMCCIMMEKCTV